MEKTLDLCRVRINHDHVVYTNDFQKIGDHPRHDRFPPAMPPVGPPVTEKWHYRHDACGPGATAGIRESQKFDQVIVGRWRGRLYLEDLFAPRRFQNLHADGHPRQISATPDLALTAVKAVNGLELYRSLCLGVRDLFERVAVSVTPRL